MIPVNEPVLGYREKELLTECIDTGWISSEGRFVHEFESRFAKRVGRRFGISVCNGSVALDMAVEALNIGPGDEVIMPAFTIISNAAAIIRCGARPVLVDSDPGTWNMDVSRIESKITRQTKAIMVVHIYGLPTDMNPVLELADKYNLLIIEDAAEAIGLRYRERECGSFGNLSTFSFYPNKLITTGEGGMVVCDDENIAQRCRSLRNLCFQREKRFVHEELGWNFRMTNLQAAVGLAQLEKIENFIQKKRQVGKKYTQLLSGIDNIQLPLQNTPYAENIYWVFGIILNSAVGRDAHHVMQQLAKYEIGTRPFFWPMHLQPVFQSKRWFVNESYPVAEMLGKRGFYLPSGLNLSEQQISDVARALGEVLR